MIHFIIAVVFFIVIGFLFGYFIHGKTNLSLMYQILCDFGGFAVLFAIIYFLYNFSTGVGFIDELIVTIMGIVLSFLLLLAIILFIFGIWLGDLVEKKK
ncbi:MAG: hypothetical protein KAT28_00530 [Candidatus Aenigmarchaeota archaeon]|nr:hypothetical protein [Candidatus Aenigmarchaeota archaeon]